MTDNRAITKEDMQDLIINLNLPDTILELFNEVCTDDVLKKNGLLSEYTYPYKILELNKIQQDEYLINRYKPFFSFGNNTIFAYDMLSKGYIKYTTELMDKEPKIFTWDGLFVTEILRWFESEMEDQDILYIGNLFGLKYTQDILSDIYTTMINKGFSTVQKVIQWENTMLDKINGQITIK